MSVVHDSLQRGSNPVQTWYVRTADSAVYGPVQLSVLCEWAAQGRIVPGNEISENGQTWQPVESLPELKLDWVAQLPEGRTYGPFNVLAVPYLFSSGTLPADATLLNRHTGKTLQVRDMIKTSAPAEVKTLSAAGEDKEKKWEDRYHEEKRARLLREAQLQETIDRLTNEAKASTEARRETQERVQRESTEFEQLQQRSRTAEQQLKQTVDAFQADLRAVKAQADNAERELAEQRKNNETLARQTASTEERLKEQVERLKRELQLAGISQETAKKDLAEERRNSEALKRQTQIREQELNRLVEEARKDAEGRAGMLERTSRDLQATEAGKSDALTRAKEEEAKLKSRIEKVEKELQSTARELAEQKKRSLMLERDNAQKDAKFQVQAADFKKKNDAVTADLERLKNEAESQRSLRAEMEKTIVEKESSLKREALFARSAMVKAEHELAAVRKQSETFRDQCAQKEGDFHQRIEQLTAQLQTSSDEVERLTRQAATRDEGERGWEARANNAAAEAERHRAQLAEKQAEHDTARKEARDREAALEKALHEQIQQSESLQQEIEKKEALLSGVQATESKKDEELNRQIRVLRDKNEWTAQALREQQERYRQLEQEQATEKDKVRAAAAAQEEKLAAAIAASKMGEDLVTREESRSRELEWERRVKGLEAETLNTTTTVKGLEEKLVVTQDARQAAERKAEAFAQELNRVRVEQQKLRQQHEALQDVVKRQEKAAAERAKPATMETVSEVSRISSVLARIAAVALLVVAVVALAATCSAIAFWIGSIRSREVGIETGLEMARSEKSAIPSAKEAPRAQPRKGVAWPVISAAGVKVTAGEKECALIFESGVFSSRAVISSEAMDILAAVAAQLRGKMSDFNLIIEGHADSTPVTSEPSGNLKLGLARANAVLDFLKTKGGLPAESLKATSKGEEDPPFSNDDETSRRKNRTVVLKLVPK